MPDLDDLAARLDHELPDPRWDDAATLRHRGTRRRHAAVAGAAAAAVLVVALGSWAVAGRPEAGPPPISPAPTARPVPTSTGAAEPQIPDAALLQPADVRSDYEIQNAYLELPGVNPAWPFGAAGCPQYAALEIDAFRHYTAFRGHSVSDAQGRNAVHEEVRRYAADRAAEVMTDVERVVEACSLFENYESEFTTEERPTTAERAYDILDRDFAGDESLLVRLQIDVFDQTGTPIDRSVVVHGVVRVGDLVAFVLVERDDVQRTRELTAKAALRLRDA